MTNTKKPSKPKQKKIAATTKIHYPISLVALADMEEKQAQLPSKSKTSSLPRFAAQHKSRVLKKKILPI